MAPPLLARRSARDGAWRRRRTLARLIAAGVVALALVSAMAGVGAAADATWKTHRDRNCGTELRYPPAYEIEVSGARDHCALWMRLGVREARALRVLFTVEIREMESIHREEVARSGARASARDFALREAALQCMADGPDGSTYCVDGEMRSTFRTAQGFRGFEIHQTEVRESVAPRRTERHRRAPVLALDLSDGEAIRVLMASAEPARQGELRAILDTFRVWTRARRAEPRVVEAQPWRAASAAFTVRVATGWEHGAGRWPPGPVTSWLVIDPRGRRLGRDPATGAWHAEASAVTQSAMAESGFMLRERVEGRYQLEVTASVPAVAYEVVAQAPDREGKPATARRTGRTAEPGAVDRYEILYSPASAPAVTIAEVRDLSRLTILLSGRGAAAGDLILTDPRGRRTGLDPAGRVEHRAIPRSSYLDEGAGQRSMVLDVRQPADGTYTLQMTGTAAGRYSLDLRAWDRGGTATARPELRDVPMEPGVVHLYRLDYGSTAPAPVRLGGGVGSGPDRLLAFAHPTSDDVRLRPGTTAFPLIVFYGAGIDPVTFSAMLNGDNVSGRFRPEPESHEVVPIPLAPGANTLVLSVAGRSASGQAATETRRLVFWVE